MIVVTGGAGFIGSNLVRALEARGREVMVVDDLSDGRKFANLADCAPVDYWDRARLAEHLTRGAEFARPLEAVLHQGACTDTTEWDGRYMLENNYEYSKRLLEYCLERRVPFVYASSAAVYGRGPAFREERRCESPLNVYAFSKCLLDRYVERRLAAGVSSPVVGLRYFNVYGPGEAHKGRMASIVWQLREQLLAGGPLKLFAGSHGHGDGEQRRDFVYVDDVVSVVLWFLEHDECSGVFNVGSGRAQSFNEAARAVIAWYGRGTIEYVPFPDSLRERYQSFTEADLGRLREAGYRAPFLSVEEGVPRYLDALERSRASESL